MSLFGRLVHSTGAVVAATKRVAG